MVKTIKTAPITSANPFIQIAIDICIGSASLTAKAEEYRIALKLCKGDATKEQELRHQWRVGFFMATPALQYTEAKALETAEKSMKAKTKTEHLAYENGNTQWRNHVLQNTPRALKKAGVVNQVAPVKVSRALKAELVALLESFKYADIVAALKTMKPAK